MSAHWCKGGWESEFSSFYLAKPYLTQEGYLKGEVQAVNRTHPHGGGHFPSVGIPAEFPRSLASLLEYGFLLPPVDMPEGLFPQENGPLIPFVPPYLWQTPVAVSGKFWGPLQGGEQLKGRCSEPASFLPLPLMA